MEDRSFHRMSARNGVATISDQREVGRSAGTPGEKWISHHFTRTYLIAANLSSLARSPDYRELEEFWIHFTSVEDLLPSWQRITVVHHFARWVAHRMFYKDTVGPYLAYYEPEIDFNARRILPVDVAMMRYGLTNDFFRIPPSDGEWVEIKPRMKQWKESNLVADACYTYFTEDVMWSEPYDRLLAHMAEEVFHIVFNDRATLSGLNQIVAGAVLEKGESDPDPAKMTKRGRIRRRTPPVWVRRAAFHRDRGKCAFCGRDVSGLVDPMAISHYDHIIPLDQGGVNDVTNIQLACGKCNTRKAAEIVEPSTLYRRWY